MSFDVGSFNEVYRGEVSLKAKRSREQNSAYRTALHYMFWGQARLFHPLRKRIIQPGLAPPKLGKGE